jgi:AcrR family transcriptional regulator
MASRRMGPPDAAVRFKLLDATERVLARSGYPAVTSRNVGQEAGVDQKLVFYYFKNMEELIVATFRRRSETFLGMLQELEHSPSPIRQLWALSSDRSGRLVIEFMAMATRNEALRKEVAAYTAKANEIVDSVLKRATENANSPASAVNAHFLNFAIASLARNIIVEGELGLLESEAELRRSIDLWLEDIELPEKRRQ